MRQIDRAFPSWEGQGVGCGMADINGVCPSQEGNDFCDA